MKRKGESIVYCNEKRENEQNDETESESKSVMHERRIERNDSKFAADEDVCI